jgi:hypothetical protein
MSDSLPKTMKALVQTEEKGVAAVKEIPLPKLEGNDVLIKVEYIAQVGGLPLFHINDYLAETSRILPTGSTQPSCASGFPGNKFNIN